MNTSPTYEAFETAALAQGFDEVLVREWAPGQQIATHTHPFEVQALVVRGELALTCNGHTRRIVAGSGFELALEVPHAEHYGPEGATFWVARKHPKI
jgi:quercetin dioxygenase-like cupin family protein